LAFHAAKKQGFLGLNVTITSLVQVKYCTDTTSKVSKTVLRLLFFLFYGPEITDALQCFICNYLACIVYVRVSMIVFTWLLCMSYRIDRKMHNSSFRKASNV
jgi:hypothetical protein